ncbi:uncharacterized protein LOC117779847 [Drosophila innubila]|uniref:uncharacterized protein LOC117779847 n=1 Tax=Drosophila innubila TaxID=198719 RepID=UPI00148E4047|nr:uncharacterized protein LOC117779847 [Drosophila innubila]
MGNINTKPKAKNNAEVDLLSLLNHDCWERVISYLDVRSQIRIAFTSDNLYKIFKNYARQKYKHINKELTKTLSKHESEHLLKIIGEHVLSYQAPECHEDEKRYTEIELFLQSSTESKIHIPFVIKKRRNLYKQHFEMVIKMCPHLELFEFRSSRLTRDLNYEIICQLLRLKHLRLWIGYPLRPQFLEVLTQNPGLRMESLALQGVELSKEQVQQICTISSLKRLDLTCDWLPVELFLKLQPLEHLKLNMPSILNEGLLKLVKDLPHLSMLNILCCPLITEDFVVEAYAFIRNATQREHKLSLSLNDSNINWKNIDSSSYYNYRHLLEITDVTKMYK